MYSKIRFFLLLFFCIGPIAFIDAQAQEPQISEDSQQDFVSQILPYNIDWTHDHIELLFNSEARDYYEDYSRAIYNLPDNIMSAKDLPPSQYRQFLKFPIARSTKFYVFFGAYENMQHVLQDMTPMAAMGHSNAALQRYAALSQDDRAEDIYLWSPDTPYWYSQYSLNGKPLPFRSYFILHLTAVDDTHTSVEVIENQPVVQLGKKLSVDENGRVHRYDIREVEPTTQDRQFLLSCIRQFMDRKVPGRHWFNCKTQAELDAPAPVPFTVP